MNPPIRKRRTRRTTDSTQSVPDPITQSQPSLTSAEPTDTQSQHDDPPGNTPQITVDSNTPTHQAAIDRI